MEQRMPLYGFALAASWLAHVPDVYVYLLCLIVLDIVTGFARAFVQGTVSSSASRKGMVRKAMLLLTVAVVEVAERSVLRTSSYNLGISIATMFCLPELISCLENLAACGVPIPEMVLKRLAAKQDKGVTK